jgi:hypothetical protein
MIQNHIRKEIRNTIHVRTNLLTNKCHQNPNLLDFFIFKLLPNNYLDTKINLEIALHRTPKIATNSKQVTTCQQPPKLHNSKTNWEAFRTEIEGNLGLNIQFKTAEEIEEAITQFSKVIQKAAWGATPDNKLQAKYLEYPWKFKDHIKEKRKLRRRWQMSRHPEDKRRYNEAARKMKHHIRSMTMNTK